LPRLYAKCERQAWGKAIFCPTIIALPSDSCKQRKRLRLRYPLLRLQDACGKLNIWRTAMNVWRRLCDFLGLPSARRQTASALSPAQSTEKANFETATAANIPAETYVTQKDEIDCGEDLEKFLLLANRQVKAKVRHCDRRGRWWIFETDNEGNLTAAVYRLEQSAAPGLADFLAHRRMSISFPRSGCERAWLEDPESEVKKFHGALRDALLAIRATASIATKDPSPLLAQLIYPGGESRFNRWVARLAEIYKQGLLGVVAISSRKENNAIQRHFAAVLADEICGTAEGASAQAGANLVIAEARKADISEPTAVLPLSLLWEECRGGKPQGVRFLAAAEPIYDTPFLAALRAYDRHVQMAIDRMGDLCRLYLLQGDILRGTPQENGELQAATLVADIAYKQGDPPLEEIRRNLRYKFEQDWQEAIARCGSRFRLNMTVRFTSELPSASGDDAMAAMGSGVPLFFRSPLPGDKEKVAPAAGRDE